MDIDSQHESGDELHQSDVVSQEVGSYGDFESLRARREQQSSSEATQKRKRQTQNYSQHKWELLQKSYSDGYAELLHAERTESWDDGVPPGNLQQSQVGAVTWYPSEKDALFKALTRKGLRDLPQLACAIGSKSQLEVRDCLLLLREKESERYLFHRQTKTISYADIPAAVEIGPDIEEMLGKAADAQLAYEEHYDHVAGTQENDGSWIIDSEVSQQLDLEQDNTGDALEEESEVAGEPAFETPIFHLSTFIELSERFFMNCGDPSTNDNWRIIAMEGETPAVTQEVISELYDLAVNFTRKLIQASLFLAESRQRATATSNYRHRAMIRDQDVAAAIGVLNLKCDLWDFWVGVPRRNKLNVVEDKRTARHGKKKSMSYNVVEQILSKKKARWRGRRRSSAGADTSMTEDEAFDTADQISQDDEGDSVSSASQDRFSTDEDGPNIPEAHPLDAILDGLSSTEVQDDSSHLPSSIDSASETSSDSSDDFGGSHAANPRQKHQQMYREYEQDDYLEKIDAGASRKEEIRLWEILGHEKPMSIKPENGEGGNVKLRPRIMRKLMEDFEDPLASVKHAAEWEVFGAPVPNDSFVETERARKRTRTIPRSTSTNADSSKSHLPFRTRDLSTETRETESAEEL